MAYCDKCKVPEHDMCEGDYNCVCCVETMTQNVDFVDAERKG